ncbi:HD-GYP domain-containing protein [Cohnella suwonensis]|uniref:HD-GYP domain-containing protein n=1 Tax=Cohnella suwonensis TaxID=696072 RepID=A0ABW0LTE5_9BACL
MKEVTVSGLMPGSVLAKPVLGKGGNTMLETGTTLTENYIRRLKDLGITSVYVQPSELIGFKGKLSPSAYSNAGLSLKLLPDNDREALKENVKARMEAASMMQDFSESNPNLENIGAPMRNPGNRRILRNIWQEIINQRILIDEFSVLLQTDRFMFEHSLRVGILSSVMGIAQSYDQSKLYELTLGALLFDIGMTLMPAELIRKQRKLTPEEMKLIQRHTTEGYRILSSVPGIPAASAKCALLHHERFRGEGYPFGFKFHDIPVEAQMVGLADLYDALMSPRHHRKAFSPGDAMEYLFAAGNYDFDLELVQIFLKNVSVYPVSSVIQLSSGQIGIVTSVDSELNHRPIVRIIREADGSKVLIPYDLDLRDHRNVVILSNLSLSM